jgi:hypothetical protein
MAEASSPENEPPTRCAALASASSNSCTRVEDTARTVDVESAVPPCGRDGRDRVADQVRDCARLRAVLPTRSVIHELRIGAGRFFVTRLVSVSDPHTHARRILYCGLPIFVSVWTLNLR